MTALEVNEGDVIRIHTGSGGGYGDPAAPAARARARRPPERLRHAERAAAVYGVG